MIVLAALILAAAPEPLSLEPFMDEEVAGRALDEHLYCLGTEAFERRDDSRDAKTLAADVVEACSTKATALQNSLADVYRRKPTLLRAGETADGAAKTYVAEMNARVELVIEKDRKRN